MKRCFPIVMASWMAIGVLIGTAAPCNAENPVLKRECETKALNAAELIISMGTDAAFKKITDPQGPFVSKTSHVFCIDAQSGSLLAHKVARFVGSNMHYYTDSGGNHPYTGILNQATKAASGWTDYMTYGSGPERRKKPGLKHMYFLKVSGKDIVLCCGYWDDA